MNITELLEQIKQASTTVPNNEQEMQSGRSQVYPDPAETSEPGCIATPWGDGSITDADKLYYSKVVENASEQSRPAMLERLFHEYVEASNGAQAFVKEHFANGASGTYKTHSAMLQRKSGLPTIGEQAAKVK